MKVKQILEATALGRASELVLGDKNSSTLEKTIHAADRAFDAYTIASLAATAGSGGLAAPSLGLALLGKAATKGAGKLLIKGAEKGAEKVAEKAALEMGKDIGGAAAKEIAKSESKKSTIKNIGNFILNILSIDNQEAKTGAGEDPLYITSSKGEAGEITAVGPLKGALCASIDCIQQECTTKIITWAIKIGSDTKLISVIDRDGKVTIPKNPDNNAKAVFNKTEIPLYKLAIILTNIYKPSQVDVNKMIQPEDIGSYLIGMDRGWLSTVEDFK